VTTTVFYPAAQNSLLQQGDTATTAARALAREITQAATIAERVFANGSGSTTMTSGTFTNTPTSGDVLIAILGRRADGQATITNPTGWTKLTSGATSGSRSLEVWWYRSTGVAADKGSFSWTVTSATNAWGIELIRFGGSAAYADPTVKTAATAFTSTSTPAATTASPDQYSDLPGMTLNCIVVNGTSLGAGGITSAFSGTGTAESTTSYYDSTFGAMAATVNDIYNNASTSVSYGAAYTLGAARVGHQAQIHLEGGGQAFIGAATGYGAGINSNVTSNSFPGALVQSYLTYDTSSIPDGNTVTSATLGLRALSSMLGGFYSTTDPANATLQARYYGTSITDTRGYNNSTWALSPTGMAAKTLVATYAAASAWTNGTDYTLTSQAAFTANINKTGNTVLILTTDDFATSTARSSRETYAFDVTGTYAPLTVVHNYQATVTLPPTGTLQVTATPTITRTGAAFRTLVASVTASPTITRALAATRTLAATLTASPTVARTVAAYRTALVTITTIPTIARTLTANRTVAATIDTTPTITRTAAFARVLEATVDASPALTATVAAFRTLTATLGTIPSLLTEGGHPAAVLYHHLSLKVRSTITLPGLERIRLTVRSRLRLPE
jgi:hypothetical protein